MPPATSISSNLSNLTARSASASHFSSPPPPSSLSLSKASTSAALTSTDESDDFRRFLDEAHAKDNLQRRNQTNRPAKLAAPERANCRQSGATESLRRVASSSTINSVSSQRAGNASTDHSPLASGRIRNESTFSSAASRAPRSVSNYSAVTFRNPTSQFLENLSVEAQTPELGIDDTPITGRAVDNRSHLTAIGHAAQLQSRSASASHSSKSVTIRSKAPSSTSSRLHGTSPQSCVPTLQKSPQAALTSTPRITSPTALSPRSRPQSYFHTPPSEASGIVSPRKLGAIGLGHGLPKSPGCPPLPNKRSADQMERSSSLQSSVKLQEAAKDLEAPAMQHSPCQPASRRKTWFGLAWPSETHPSAESDTRDEPMQAVEALQDRPPPMSEEEAAFRRSLGYDDVFDPSVDSEHVAHNSSDLKAFPGGRDSDATIKAEPSSGQIPVRERRVSWLPWRNVTPLTTDAPVSSMAETQLDGSGQQQQQPQQPQNAQQQNNEVSDSPDQTTLQAMTQEAPPAVAEQEQNTVTYRTVVKRGWMGARYEVQEPVSGLCDVSDPSTHQPPIPISEQGAASTTQGNNEPSADQPDQNQVSNAPHEQAGPSDAHARQTSATWRWRFWSGYEDRPEVEATSSAQQLQVPDTLPAAQPENPELQRGQTEPVVPMDIDRDDQTPAATTASDGNSWTYSSYVASWVPTWVYNAQQQESAAQANALPVKEPTINEDVAATGRSADATPRTPAEQVKADALARDTTAAVFDANKAVLNSSTRSGWVKFFASRSANLPREAPEAITDDDGIEVMDISQIEGAPRPVTARTIAPSNAGLTPDVARAPRARVATGGSLAGSKASSLAGDAETLRAAPPLSTSKESVKNLGKAAVTKAANVKAASSLGLGKGTRSDAPQAYAGDAGSGLQPAKDVSKNVAPSGAERYSSGASTPTRSAADSGPIVPANLVLPSFDDTFTRAPRMWPPKVGVLERTLSAVNSYLFSKVPDLERMKRPTRFSTYGERNLGSSASSFKSNAASFQGGRPTQRLAGKAKATGAGSSKDKGVETALKEVAESAQRLPRAWSTVGMHERAQTKGTAGIGKIVVIGVHGWFTQSIFKNMIGEPTGTSAKFAAMQTESIRRHFLEAGLELNPEAITAISLQGDGKVADRVDRLFSELISRPNWVNDLKNADAIFLSAHSQGAIVATQLLARLIEQRHVRAQHTRVCLLAMCGIHHGPFAHLKSSITASYINYFETAAAKELFEFQSSSTAVAKQYTAALKIVLDAGAKCVYVGSTDDNVVPIYSALNSSNNHPSILRALYIDGQAFPKVDFLTNLLVLCVAVRNAGLSDHNLLTLLSASVAGSLYGGLGHSKVYEERAVYDLATRYLFEVTHPLAEPTFVPGAAGASAASTRRVSSTEADTEKVVLVSEAFEAQRWNPYELPWSLRGLFEDKHVRSLFAEDMLELLQSYDEWKPDAKSKALKDLQWRLAPMRSIKPPEVELDDDSTRNQSAKPNSSKL